MPSKPLSDHQGEMERLSGTGPLVVDAMAGRGTSLVVSLAGVARGRVKVPPPEFIGTAFNKGENHVLLISDPTRSWMNAPGLAEAMMEVITSYRDRHGISDVTALGNSMGGFAAIRLAELMPLRTVIAFAPQFSADPALVPEEERWIFYRRRIKAWPHRDVGALNQPETQYYVFHGDDPKEAVHWRRFPTPPGLNHFILAGEGHNVAPLLRRRRVLSPLVRSAMAHRPLRVRQLLETGCEGVQIEVLRREVYDAR
ncbi:MAG: hypothetical protein OIF48_08170 [Silicimonas sp.]|nr:hypothetical protein [Silicimonas sp.]